MSRAADVVVCFLVVVSFATVAVGDGPSLHGRIDALMAARAQRPVAKPADDAEFLRRIYLDLSGVIPTAEQARAFLDDKDPAKRSKLIDRLLGAKEFPRRMREAFTVMLLERRPGRVVADPAWNELLERAFAENMPWDRLVAGILASDGLDPKTGAGIRFFVDGGRNDPIQLTRDVGRLFLGMDLQCARCHDHPNVETYSQADYFGLFAFLNTSKLQGGKYFLPGPTAEKVEFQSVFTGDKHSTGPRLPDGKEVAIPEFEKGQEIAVPAKDGVPAIPKFRPRKLLAQRLAAAENERFVRNSVNRFWFLMMGRGLVHPLDLLHEANPASHPQVLDLLAKEFVAHEFDVRWLLRELASTRVYQRSSRLPGGVDAKVALPQRYLAANGKALSAEQMAWSLMRATGNLDRLQAVQRPKDSKFTVKDYINGRIPAPGNLPDILTLFAGVYGNPPGEAEVEFVASMGHALFLMNDKLVFDWLKPQAGNLIGRLVELPDAKVADELYLSVLSRLPDDEERVQTSEYLERFKARRVEALSDLAWSLLTSAEFRLNH